MPARLGFLILSLSSGLARAQFGPQSNLDVGVVLIANEKLEDPNFVESVVLILQHDEDEGTVGLIINRRTQVPLSRVFKSKTSAQDPVYLGGPVDIRLIQALLRLPSKPEHATRTVGDVYVTGSKDLIDKSLKSRTEASRFHVYLGYAGWQPGQLESEAKIGAWSVLPASPNLIFDSNPDTLWSRLNSLAHGQIARNLIFKPRDAGSPETY